MEKKKGLGLLPKLIIAIILGIIVGYIFPAPLVRILVTFNSIFGNFLNFVVPLIIVGFVVPGIAELGASAGRLLGFTVLLAYVSTVISGIFAYGVSTGIIPKIVDFSTHIAAGDPGENLLESFFEIEMPPLFDVMSALLIAFILGIGMSVIKNKTMSDFFNGFQDIVKLVIEEVIIPLLPIHIAGIFANMTYAGEVAQILSIFSRVFVVIILSHWFIILVQFFVASTYSGKVGVGEMIKNQIPAYLTAIGTQSSAATIPVNVITAQNNGVRKGIREFVIPLCATIHLSGSTITITTCAITVMMMHSMPVSFGKMLGFIFMLGIAMVAAPGVPGGAIMAALGILQSMLGFSETQQALMIALYVAQDSFGTACNISGDNAVALIVDKRAENLHLDIEEDEA